MIEKYVLPLNDKISFVMRKNAYAYDVMISDSVPYMVSQEDPTEETEVRFFKTVYHDNANSVKKGGEKFIVTFSVLLGNVSTEFDLMEIIEL